MENKEVFFIKNKKYLMIFSTTLAVYLGFTYLLPLFVPFLFAYFIAWLLRPIAGFLHKRLRLPIALGGGICLLLFLSMLGIGLFYLGRVIFTQLSLLFRNIPVYQVFFTSRMESLCMGCDQILGLTTGTAWGMLNDSLSAFVGIVQTELLPKMTFQTLRLAIGAAEFFALLLIVLVSSLLFLMDMEQDKEGKRNSRLYHGLHKVTRKLSETGTAYLKTQAIILTLIAVICTIAFLLLQNPYALLLGIGIGIFDAFPVLGSGLVLIPWSMVMLFQKEFYAAALLLSTFLICQILREILEPKLLGNKLGIRPIYSLMAMYVGVQLFGIVGFFLGPLAFVIIRTILHVYG